MPSLCCESIRLPSVQTLSGQRIETCKSIPVALTKDAPNTSAAGKPLLRVEAAFPGNPQDRFMQHYVFRSEIPRSHACFACLSQFPPSSFETKERKAGLLSLRDSISRGMLGNLAPASCSSHLGLLLTIYVCI